MSNNVLDNCLNNNRRLRIRVTNLDTGNLEEDVYSTDANMGSWNGFNYHGGSVTKAVHTYWTGTTTFFSTNNGGSACHFTGPNDSPLGTVTLGTGNGSSIILAPGNTDGFEYRVNCGGAALHQPSDCCV